MMIHVETDNEKFERRIPQIAMISSDSVELYMQDITCCR